MGCWVLGCVGLLGSWVVGLLGWWPACMFSSRHASVACLHGFQDVDFTNAGECIRVGEERKAKLVAQIERDSPLPRSHVLYHARPFQTLRCIP